VEIPHRAPRLDVVVVVVVVAVPSSLRGPRRDARVGHMAVNEGVPSLRAVDALVVAVARDVPLDCAAWPPRATTRGD